MLVMFGALWQEMKPVVKALEMKKTKKDTLCPVYEDKDGRMRLVLTGVGCEAAGFAAGWYIGTYGYTKEDVYLNIGSCAGGEETSGIYRIHGITDEATKETYYPDLREVGSLPTARVYTCSKIIGQEEARALSEENPGEKSLFDMEAAGLYRSLRKIISPDRMIFLKVVTDHGREEGVTQKEMARSVVEGMEACSGELSEEIKRIYEHFVSSGGSETEGEQENPSDICNPDASELAKEFQASVTMELQLQQLLRYVVAAGMETRFWEEVSSYRQQELLPVNSRREGKKLLETLMKNIV